MRDHNRGLVFGQLRERAEDSFLCLRVQCGRRLVQNDDRGIFEIGSCHRDLLPLTLGQLHALVVKGAGHVSVEIAQVVVNTGLLQGCEDPFVVGVIDIAERSYLNIRAAECRL